MSAAEIKPLWWHTGVMYNIYVRSFKDSDGDGVGDLTGVIDKLDYLSGTLGVDILWLSGALAGPWKELGFDSSDFRLVHPAMGTMGTFDELLRQAHERGMKVIIDYIPNHTSDKHNWFVESAGSRDNPKRDWYIWRDPKPDGSPPNNWLSLFGGSAWEWDEITHQYYLHTFLKEQPELNWRSPGLKKAMFDVARYWLERGVDGFRVDAAHHILKDATFRDNPPAEPRTIFGKKMAHEYQEHRYDRDHPDVHKIYAELRAVLDEYSQAQPRFMVAEIHPAGGWKGWARYYGKNLDEFHFPFNNGFISAEWTAANVRRLVDEVEAALPEGAWPNAHTGNFDEWRVVSRYGEHGARQAAMLLLTMRGTPMFYYGEEIGMSNTPVAPQFSMDPMGKRTGLDRDPQRSPMQWAAAPHAGFSDHTTAKLWLPVSSNHRTINVESELQDPRSMLNLYRALIVCRKASPTLQLGSYVPLDDVPADCYVYLRQGENGRTLTALNFSDRPQLLSLGDCGQGQIKISTYMDLAGPADLENLALRPQEGLLIELVG